MSVKGHTHLEIETYLKQQVPTLKWFDKDKAQLENLNNHVIPLPAVFFSFGRTPYTDQGNKIQKGDAVLRFRIAYENYADSFTGSTNQEKALEFFEFNDAIYKALQGLSTTYLRNVSRIADEDDTDHKNVIVTIMEFSAILIDDAAEEGKNFTLVDPELTVEYKKPLSVVEAIEDNFDIPE